MLWVNDTKYTYTHTHTCIRPHTHTHTDFSSSTNNTITTDDHYSLGQLIDCVYDEATPTKPPTKPPPTYNPPLSQATSPPLSQATSPPLSQATNPPPVMVEASKEEEEFYNAENHMYAAVNKKANGDTAEADGKGENKTEEGSNQPVYDVAMPGEAVWGVEGSDEYSRLKH